VELAFKGLTTLLHLSRKFLSGLHSTFVLTPGPASKGNMVAECENVFPLGKELGKTLIKPGFHGLNHIP
jgi:hypothetical protein